MFVLLGLAVGGVFCWFGLCSVLGCMVDLFSVVPIGASRGTGAQKNEARNDPWLEKLIRGLTVVAREVPEARVRLYQLLAALCQQ